MTTACEPLALQQARNAITRAALEKRPFAHLRGDAILAADAATETLLWLEQVAAWRPLRGAFYDQFVCDDFGTLEPSHLATTDAFVACLAQELERRFGGAFDVEKSTVAAHRLLPGHQIGLHNDNPRRGTETHRFLIYLSRPDHDLAGGELVLLDPTDIEASAVVIEPLHNSFVAMEFSAASWHCVERVTAGTRYALVYSFWRHEAAA